jgi:hypothetical protein
VVRQRILQQLNVIFACLHNMTKKMMECRRSNVFERAIVNENFLHFVAKTKVFFKFLNKMIREGKVDEYLQVD